MYVESFGQMKCHADLQRSAFDRVHPDRMKTLTFHGLITTDRLILTSYYVRQM
jgi:hypothetical protein